ncbi:MAG: glycine cleavage system protein GcvH [bacterium]
MADYIVPSELRYSDNHEWVRDLGGGRYRTGITDYAAQHIGDVTYVELPEIGSEIDKDAVDCTIETVKSSEDIFNHVSGQIVAVNDLLSESPETINSDCYGDGWLYEVKADNDDDFASLMTAEEYERFLAEQEN